MFASPIPNTVYAVQFKSPINNLDGIYRLLAITTLDVVNSLETYSIKHDLYAPYLWGDTNVEGAVQYETDLSTIRSEDIYHLYPVNSGDYELEPEKGIYVPSSLLAKVPDPNVIKVRDLKIVSLLGTYATSDSLANLKTQIEDIVLSVTGQTGTTQLLQTNPTWISKAAYTTIETDRANAVNAQVTFTEQIQIKDAEIVRLQGIIQAYQAILAAQGV